MKGTLAEPLFVRMENLRETNRLVGAAVTPAIREADRREFGEVARTWEATVRSSVSAEALAQEKQAPLRAAKEFLSALAAGNADALTHQTTLDPALIDHLLGARSKMDFGSMGIVRVLADWEAAAALTSLLSLPSEAGPVGFGLSLRRQDARWIVTDLEPVVDKEWDQKFIDLFQQSHPVPEEIALVEPPQHPDSETHIPLIP